MKTITRLLVITTIFLSSLFTITNIVHAKILNKDMVDKAVLAAGYSADFCPINFQGDYSNMSTFFQNKETFPCVGDNVEFRFGQVSLYLRQSSPDSPAKSMANVVLFGEDIFRLDSIGFTYYPNPESGGTFTDEMHETIKGLEQIDSTTLHRTHPSLPGGQETLQNSGISTHYGLDGKIDGIIYMLSGRAYKLVSINTEVHDKVLVDYTIGSPAPTVSTNVDLLQYKNSEYQFLLNYPKRFIPDIGMADPAENYETVAILKTPQEDEKIYINIIKNIDIYKNSSAIDVAKREIMDSGYKYDVTPTKVNQYSGAITVLDVDEPQIHSVSITIKHPKKNLYVVLVLPRDMSKVEFEQILSSFTFTDQKIDSTSNWKTYENDKYNFTIKHPKDFKVDEYADGVYVTIYKGVKIDSPPMDPYGKSLSITLAFRTDLSDPDAACNEYETGIIGQCSNFNNIGIKSTKEKVAINGSIGVYVQKDDNTGKTYYLKKIDGNRVVEISLWNGDIMKLTRAEARGI